MASVRQQLLLPALVILLEVAGRASVFGARRRTQQQRAAEGNALPQCTDVLTSREGLEGTSCALFPAGEVPGERAGSFGPESSYIMENGVDRISNVTVPSLLPFLAAPNASKAAIIIAPGGGYEILDWNGEGTDVATWLKGFGISAFVLKYRVPERSWLGFGEAPRRDAQRAMRLVRHRAEALGLDPNKIGFMGFSAGGHLTSETSTRYEEDFYPRVDEADDVSSRPDLAFLQYPWKLLGWFDIVKAKINSNTPPSFLVHAQNDEVARVVNSEYYYDELVQRGVKDSELHVFDKASIPYGHGYGNCIVPVPMDATVKVCTWPRLAEAFMNTLWEL